ncbi:hypothetical protein DMB92_05525 [Campylobacter sp. MIT 99-7217]|uniref:flagellar filament capping protein FliD n=1 Tax=Campylobacter sp. MIT 99-7217 TaxID=535091 RepID=UPI00115B3C75|nr:flagellar filament capping protein FliD [Campylobacter sp. MIT 99-7217]TQR31846.1 hypothetical protein DMB92_05525 [Campylobacter sp. MIT 99-7217]
MALGQLGSLGLGSNVLTQDTLEKLKKAEESSQLNLYTTSIEKNTAKQKALTELKTKLSAFQTQVKTLGDSTAFSKRSVTASVTGDSAAASLTASSGVALQNVSVSVSQIAEKDVFQSKGIKAGTELVLAQSQNAGKFTLTQGSKTYTISVDSNTTFQDLAERIATASNGDIQAKIINTGEADTPYRLTISSKNTGTDSAISFTDDDNILQNALGWSFKTDDFAKDSFSGFSVANGTNKVANLSDPLGSDIKFTLFADNQTYEISATANETYQDLIDRVNQTTNGKVKLNYSSSDQTMSFSGSAKIFEGTLDTASNTYKNDSATGNFFANTLGMKVSKNYSLDDANNDFHIKHARNAEFTLDGIKMVRQSNEVKDIGAGLALTLKKTGDINFDVKQDTEGISSAMEELATAYNDLMTTLDTYTKYDTDTKVAGDLQGVSQVTSIRSTIINSIFQTQSIEGSVKDDNDKTSTAMVMVSLQDFGLTLNESGTMSFSKSKFDTKISDDIDFAEKFFAGVSGFEDINVVSKSVKLDTDVDFTGKEFKIVFNDKTYDLSKTKDGQDFVLSGKDAAERARNLLDHINSFQIEDLKVKIQEVNMGTNGTEYLLKFNSDNGSDFEIKGDKTSLEAIGLEEKKVTPSLEEGTGVFASLATILDGMTSTRSNKEGSLTLLDKQITSELKSLNETKKKTQERIDARYESMELQWLQYDLIISKLKTQSNTITQMINAANNNNN